VGRRYDVVVMGEVLVELLARGPLAESATLTLSFSGDALNAAAAAAAQGASVGLLARIGDDELGDALSRYVARCGVDTALLRRVPQHNGAYLVTDDPDAHGGFVYMRRGSAGSTLEPADVEAAAVHRSGALVVSGVTQAISPSAAAAAEHAARLVHEAGGIVVYDPNYRARLTDAGAAVASLARIAPLADVVLPSHPVETRALLGARTPAAGAAACRLLGAAAVAVTCGADGVLLDAGARQKWIPAAPVKAVADATGAGDALAGTVAACLAQGAALDEALERGVRAAARALSLPGGTGWVVSPSQR
jgi:2-dehydro-3-deoxygluconokinase